MLLIGCWFVNCRSALNGVLSISEKHRHAAARAAGASSGSSKHLRDVPLNQTYHADPLNLSPLADLSQAYLFVANARRMVCERMSSSCSEVSSSMLQSLSGWLRARSGGRPACSCLLSNSS